MSVYYTAGIANITTIAALLLAAVSFSTDNWIAVTVAREGLKLLASGNPMLNISLYTNPSYFTRNRGLFRTCYQGDKDELLWLEKYEPKSDIINEKCLHEVGYEMVQRPSTLGYGPAYHTRKHLMRAHVGFQVCCLMMLFAGMIGGAGACWNYSAATMRICGLLVFMGSFFMSGAMAFFHGYEYLEKQKINVSGFYKSWSLDVPLRDYAKYEYSYSYILGWLATAIAFISAILFLISAHQITNRKYEGWAWKERKESRNPAYDFMEQAYGVPYKSSYSYDNY